MFSRISLCFFCILFLGIRSAAAEIQTTSEDQKAISLTIYNSNLALVRDLRTISLPKGEHSLAFKEISAKIQPETALLKGKDIEVLEQNYEFDLLSPASLLQKYVGRKVSLMRSNPKTGEEHIVDAKVLSVAQGLVMQVGDNIETKFDERIIFPDVPENLRERPTLTMLVESGVKEAQNLELSYLTGGLSWKADYIAELNEAEDRLDLRGWITLINNSGASYKNAKLQLIAGDVHRAEPERGLVPMVALDSVDARRGGERNRMSRESLFEYHLYTVDRPTTILENQSKQITLLQESNGKCRKELVLNAKNQNYYWTKVGEIGKGEGVETFLILKNDAASNLGSPKPAGIVRVYKKDSAGFSQFIGEDRIDHTPENELIEIQLGRSFDVTADRVQTDFEVVRHDDKNRRIYESEYEIVIRNAKDRAVTVRVEENIPGEWQMLQESQPHIKLDSATVSWEVKVAAKGSTLLRYRVRSITQ